MSGDNTDSKVPFSPIPTETGLPMKFDATDDWTYAATPMRVLWEQNYRDAAHSLIFGKPERALSEAKTARAMEDAYLTRTFAEHRGGRA